MNSNVEVKVITTSNAGMSGTNARKALLSGDKEAFFKFLPSQVEEKDEIFNILRPAVKETDNLDDGKAAPYGIFDLSRNDGFIALGKFIKEEKTNRFLSSDTPEFAVESIEKWWLIKGVTQYSGNKLLI